MIKLITQAELKELLHYDPNTGYFKWIESGAGRGNGVAGGFCGANGYVTIGINYKIYYAHRLAWLYVYGVWPKTQIDHINHVRKDNRIINLQEATNQENGKNISIGSRNTSRIIGVSWDKQTDRWQAQIRAKGKNIRLGRYPDKFEAICARKSAENKYDYHANHGVKQ